MITEYILLIITICKYIIDYNIIRIRYTNNNIIYIRLTDLGISRNTLKCINMYFKNRVILY